MPSRIDYNRQMEETLATRSRKRLLLHVCCAPCATAVIERLLSAAEVTMFYYNPNIMPPAEYEKRLTEVRRLAAATGVALLTGDYDVDAYRAKAAGMESLAEGGARCAVCFDLRLGRTAARAAADGFEWICTTLTVSPHKDAEAINRIGLLAAERAGVQWLPADFKKRDGYRRSVELSAELGLYRQNYCGCRWDV